VTPPIGKILRSRCTADELQNFVGGTPLIDTAEWRRSTGYKGGFSQASPNVTYFWGDVNTISEDLQRLLLTFVTGSPNVPAAGFDELMGYSGQRAQFCVEYKDAPEQLLPTAHTCFNTMLLPNP
jgi:hypothetical protein